MQQIHEDNSLYGAVDPELQPRLGLLDTLKESAPELTLTAKRHGEFLVPLLAAGFLVLHVILLFIVPAVYQVSHLCNLLVLMVDFISCLLVSREAGGARALWLLLAAKCLMQFLVRGMDVLESTRWGAHIPGSQVEILLLSLSILPMLLAVSLQFGRVTRQTVQYTTIALIAGVCGLFVLLVFPALTGHGTEEELSFATNLFFAFDFFIAITATSRAFGAERDEERRFFSVLQICYWVGTLILAAHDYVGIIGHARWSGLLPSIPGLLLLILVWQPMPRFLVFPAPTASVAQIVRTGSPIFLVLVILLMGILASRSHFYLGTAAILFSVINYAVLNVLSLSRGLETEENLLAAKHSLEALVGIDPLTGIANRRAFDERIHHECHIARYYGSPLSLLMIDVDYFKQLNDTRGHLVGDDYLRRIARAFSVALPHRNEFLVRYGGEEFAVLLPTSDAVGAQQVAGYLHATIAALNLPHATSPTGTVTISIGIASYDPVTCASPIDLIHHADQALYLAKSSGRNATRGT